jgi:hypothetical protein
VIFSFYDLFFILFFKIVLCLVFIFKFKLGYYCLHGLKLKSIDNELFDSNSTLNKSKLFMFLAFRLSKIYIINISLVSNCQE